METFLAYIKRVEELQHVCYTLNDVSDVTANRLKDKHNSIALYAEMLARDGIDTSSYTEHLVKLPSKLNEFTKVAYLGLLKEKYEN